MQKVRYEQERQIYFIKIIKTTFCNKKKKKQTNKEKERRQMHVHIIVLHMYAAVRDRRRRTTRGCHAVIAVQAFFL